ncbi:MAG: NUDIX hydrolase [Deltaproteobacteria bacterium]|nr:NUDIX hydrolase [Deltaproteobacteria bacterium]MBI5809993.1 NUDIX hydrolase [Deltaproteobacteria bacterium]
MTGGGIKTERRISAGGVVFRSMGKTVEVALISVKHGKVWGLPKGAVEEGENLARTAHREVKEETGLDGRIVKNLGHVEYFFTFKDDSGSKRVFKIVYFFLMEYTGGSVEDHDTEVDECRWFPIDTALALMKYEDEKGIIKKAKEVLLEEGYIKN